MKVRLKCPASVQGSKKKDAFGYSRVYNALKKHLPNEPGIELVEDRRKADLQVTYMQPIFTWAAYPWWGMDKHEDEMLYTTWETTQIPKDWVPRINEGWKSFASTSQWCVDMIKDCGVTLPGYNIPHGVDQGKFEFRERDPRGMESKFWPGKKFVVLWQGMSTHDRKGRNFARDGFERVRDKQYPWARFLEKIFDIETEGLWRQRMRKICRAYPDIWFVEKTYPMAGRSHPNIVNMMNRTTEMASFLSAEDYQDLMASCSLFVYPSRGEAFGLMPLETLATGMPTALTNWGGMTEYYDERYFTPIDYSLSEVGEDFFSTTPWMNFQVDPGQDAVAHVDSIEDAIVDAYHNRERAFEQAAKGAEWVKKEWTWKRGTSAFVDACKQFLNQ